MDQVRRRTPWTLVVLLLSLLWVGLSTPAEANEMIVPLLAGQHYEVGEVAIWQLGSELYVEYRLDEGYAFVPDGSDSMLSATHLHVFTDEVHLSDIPTAGRNRNPQPGLFDSNQRPELVQQLIIDERLVLYVIPLERFIGHAVVHVAAHAVVEGVFGAHGAAASVRTEEGSIDLEVPAPHATAAVFRTEAPVHWEVRGTNITVDITSRGFEYQGPWTDAGAECFDNLHTYLRYSIASDQIAFSENGTFAPGSGSTSLGEGLVFSDWVGGSIDLVYDYAPLEREVRWCSFPAGEYLDVVTITVAGADMAVSETAWGEGLAFTERGNWAMYVSFPVTDWEPKNGSGN